MTINQEELRLLLQDALAKVQAAISLLTPPEQERVVVKAGENLQSFIDKHNEIHLESNSTFEGNFIIKKPIIIHGNGSHLIGNLAPVIDVLPSTKGRIFLSSFQAQSNFPVCLLFGHNTFEQNTIEKVPSGIHLDNIRIPSHNGKRAIEINSADTQVINCIVEDCWQTGEESKAIHIMNTTGRVLVRGGLYSAGSICAFVGGATPSIPNLIPDELIFEDLLLSRPESWRTDGVSRSVKNVFELKTGRNVILRRSVLNGSWKDGQSGYAIMLTPTAHGAINGVLIEDIKVRNAAGLINITGYDAARVNQTRTQNILLRRVNSVTSNARNAPGAVIRNFLMQGNADLTVHDSVLISDASSQVYYNASPVKGFEPMEKFEFLRNYAYMNAYGFNFQGVANAIPASACKLAIVKENKLANENSRLRTAFPDNEYLDEAQFGSLFHDKVEWVPILR